MCPIRTISRAPAKNGDAITGLHRGVLIPSAPVQDSGAETFELPVGHLAVLIRHIHEYIAVRVGPFNLCNHARPSNQLAGVVFRPERMMRHSRTAPTQKEHK